MGTVKTTAAGYDGPIYLDSHVKEWLDEQLLEIRWRNSQKALCVGDRKLLLVLWEKFIGRPEFPAIPRLKDQQNDFRLCNIKTVPWKEVMWAKKPYGKTSKYYGVIKYYRKWKVMFRNKNMGYYSTEEEAAKVYDKLAIAYYGEDYPGLNRYVTVNPYKLLKNPLSKDRFLVNFRAKQPISIEDALMGAVKGAVIARLTFEGYELYVEKDKTIKQEAFMDGLAKFLDSYAPPTKKK